VRLITRESRRAALQATFAAPETIAEKLGGDDAVPRDIAAWLGRLYTLAGVPFAYLVPDEEMLPPESIRFFALDDAWTQALLDGAFSLGRDLTAIAANASVNLDRALLPGVHDAARAAAPRRTRRGAVFADPPPPKRPWTGFLLRSTVVADYPGLGVNVYPLNHTPDDPQPKLIPIRRLDHLGPGGDTIFGLVEGDAYRVDVHEAPELLHYGFDDYTPPGGGGGGEPQAKKNLHKFTRDPKGRVKLCKDTVEMPAGSAFRTISPRVVKYTKLAALIAAKNELPSIDSGEMGFEMTEGVGMVSFYNRDLQ
jgi:hypothetical protein